jgi:hypothetical protein
VVFDSITEKPLASIPVLPEGAYHEQGGIPSSGLEDTIKRLLRDPYMRRKLDTLAPQEDGAHRTRQEKGKNERGLGTGRQSIDASSVVVCRLSAGKRGT